MKLELVKTDFDKCQGCNACVAACPQIFSSKIGKDENGNIKVSVVTENCTACGECIKACPHGARYYEDDVLRFFEDLKKGNLGVVVAPSLLLNYPKEYKKVFAWLKSKGVSQIWDTSFGADITTALYVKAIKERGLKVIINQSCRTVVESIERFFPNLIPFLSPIGSPMHCTAVYMKKKANFTGGIYGISPCISKAYEFEAHGVLKGNITFKRLMEIYRKETGGDFSKEVDFDSPESLVGFRYPTPGGLKDSIEQVFGKVFHIKRIEGPNVIQKYLCEINNNPHNLPLVIDILNCTGGCMVGTGTEYISENVYNLPSANEMDASLIVKTEEILKKKKSRRMSPIKIVKELYTKLDIDDYIVNYQKNSNGFDEAIKLAYKRKEIGFKTLNKFTDDEKYKNCPACGFNSCENAAIAIVLGQNIPESCREYSKKQTQLEHAIAVKSKEDSEIILYLSYHDQLTGLYNRRFYEEELKRLDTKVNFPLTIVMGDVNGLKIINDSFGHAIGDDLLKKVAEVITKGCRVDDIIARQGGDEFVIILPKTDALVAEEIIKRITNLSLSEKVGSIDISISFGYETKNNEKEKIQDILRNAEDHMYKKKLFESPSMRGKTIKAIINTLYEKNKREEAHSYRVSELCKNMGEALGLPEHEIKELTTVGLLHDIGKIAIGEGVLNKPGKLTNEEWEEIRRHPEIGYRILKTVNDMSDMASHVLYHHERWDGKGYPKGLKGKDIPNVSRIIAIADSYDAMTSERSYRNALPEEVVINEMQKNIGIQFDPKLVSIFIEKVLGK